MVLATIMTAGEIYETIFITISQKAIISPFWCEEIIFSPLQ